MCACLLFLCKDFICSVVCNKHILEQLPLQWVCRSLEEPCDRPLLALVVLFLLLICFTQFFSCRRFLLEWSFGFHWVSITEELCAILGWELLQQPATWFHGSHWGKCKGKGPGQWNFKTRARGLFVAFVIPGQPVKFVGKTAVKGKGSFKSLSVTCYIWLQSYKRGRVAAIVSVLHPS